MLPAGDGARRRARPRDRRDVHRGHRRREPGRDLRPGPPRARLRGAHRLSLLLPRHRGVRPRRSRTSTAIPWDDPRVAHLWSTRTPILSATRPAARPDHGRGRPARPRARRGVPETTCRARPRRAGTSRCRRRELPGAASLVLHAAAWTDVDGAEDEPQARGRGQRRRDAERRGARRARSSRSRPTTSSTGRKRAPYVESDAPSPLGAYGRTKLHGEAAAGERRWVVRSSWLFGPTGHNFVRTMLRLGAERDEVAVVDDQRGCPTYVGHLAAAVPATRRAAVRHLPRRRRRRVHVGRLRGGDLRGGGARLPRAPDHDARSSARRRRGRRTRCCASEKGAPALPHWRDGLRECLAALGARVASRRRRGRAVRRAPLVRPRARPRATDEVADGGCPARRSRRCVARGAPTMYRQQGRSAASAYVRMLSRRGLPRPQSAATAPASARARRGGRRCRAGAADHGAGKIGPSRKPQPRQMDVGEPLAATTPEGNPDRRRCAAVAASPSIPEKSTEVDGLVGDRTELRRRSRRSAQTGGDQDRCRPEPSGRRAARGEPPGSEHDGARNERGGTATTRSINRSDS